MTKYLETKTNSIEEAISSVVLGEAKFQVNYSKGGKLFSKTINAKDEDDAEDKAIKKFKIDDDDIRSVVKESLDEYTLTKLDKMMGIKKGDRVFFVSGSNAEGNVYAQNEKEAMEKAKKKGIKGKISIRDKGEYKGQPRLVNSVNEGKRISPKMLNLMKVITAYKQEKPGSKERKNMLNFINKELKAMGKQPIKDTGVQTLRLGEGYEANVMKILKKKGLEGAAYFKNNNLMVSKRDFDAVKKALRFDKIPMTPPKIVVEELDEDEKMKKLTKRQRQALSSPAAKGKGKGGITLPGAEFLSKKKKPMKVGRQSQVVKYEENEMDIVDTIRNIVEKKLDPVNPKAVKKKFDDRKDKDIDNDGDVDSTDKYLHKRRKAISKAIKNERITDVDVDQAKRDLKHAKLKKATDDVKKEVYDIGKDYAEHTLEVTPGQDKKDVDKMLNTAYTKNQSMRETLAKVWGLDEGKSPFQKEEEKPLTKTMTGQKPTKVEVEPKMEKK